ncbi:MAG: asparagine synthase-related protein, partial [Bacteroidota bacterium]
PPPAPRAGTSAPAPTCPAKPRIKLSRDRLGIKPIFYRKLDKGFAFASEIKPLTQIGSKADYCKNILSEFLAFGSVLGNRTFYKDIWEVPSGGNVSLTCDKADVLQTSLPQDFHSTYNTSTDLKSVIRGSLKKCLISDRTIGLAVSGGLDSTILAFELNAMGIKDITTFSVCIPGVSDGIHCLDELALPPNGVWNTWNHQVVTISPSELQHLIYESVSVMGQPMRMTSVPLYLKLAQAANQSGISVLLTGEGADEMFAGYPDYLFWRDNLKHFERWERLKEFSLPAERKLWLRQLFDDSTLELCHEEFGKHYSCLSEQESFSALRTLELSLRLRPLLTRVDHCLMRYGVEGRTPYLHGNVPNFSNSLSLEELLNATETKMVLREAWSNNLSVGRYMKRKHHFRLPMSVWFSQLPWMKQQIREHSETLAHFGMNLDKLGILMEKATLGDKQASRIAYSLLTFVLWHRSDQAL